jgi:hypothetical protein
MGGDGRAGQSDELLDGHRGELLSGAQPNRDRAAFGLAWADDREVGDLALLGAADPRGKRRVALVQFAAQAMVG